MELANDYLDLGVVTNNGEAMLAFYCDVLGLNLASEVTFPGLGVVKKIQCGRSTIKLLVLEKPAANTACKEGYAAATGYRYCSLAITDIEETVLRCRESGHRIAVDVLELRPGIKAAMVEDPDGNTVEFMQISHDK